MKNRSFVILLLSESPLSEIKLKAEKSSCLTKPDARSSGGEDDWLASGHLVDGNIKYDLHSLYDEQEKEDQYKIEAITDELGTDMKYVSLCAIVFIENCFEGLCSSWFWAIQCKLAPNPHKIMSQKCNNWRGSLSWT